MKTIVSKKDLVTVYGTGQSRHMPAGKKYTLHKIAADKLVAKGAASATPSGPNLSGPKRGGKGKSEGEE